jgi:hypothetical protein
MTPFSRSEQRPVWPIIAIVNGLKARHLHPSRYKPSKLSPTLKLDRHSARSRNGSFISWVSLD